MRILVIIVGLIFTLHLSATIINVPADQSTIQEGLDIASYSDTVLVANGIYCENIIWPATNGIKLIGSGEENCIIDGSQLHSVIRFEEDLGGIIDTTTIVTNFTIQNGQSGYGGGVHCSHSSPSLENITINSNSVSLVGGGIYCWYSNPNLENVTIMDNTALRGGGFSCWGSNPNLENVTIANNSATDNGGGIQCYANSNLDLENVSIIGNSAENNGAGIFCDSSNLNLSNVIITENTADNRGGGIYYHSSNSILTNALIAGNSAITFGGGIYVSSGQDLTIINVTIVDNSAFYGGGIYSTLYAYPSLVNSIVFYNLPQEIYLNNDSLTVSYSDIDGGWTGESNINTDPLFVDPENGDYHLTESSPCIDAGNPNFPFDPDGTIADIGAFYYDQGTGIEENFELQNLRNSLTNYPNPFNPTTTIEFSIQNNSQIELSVFNIKGQKVKTLINNDVIKGSHSISWNGDDKLGKSVSSGIYYYKLKINGKIEAVKKCLLLK